MKTISKNFSNIKKELSGFNTFEKLFFALIKTNFEKHDFFRMDFRLLQYNFSSNVSVLFVKIYKRKITAFDEFFLKDII